MKITNPIGDLVASLRRGWWTVCETEVVIELEINPLRWWRAGWHASNLAGFARLFVRASLGPLSGVLDVPAWRPRL